MRTCRILQLAACASLLAAHSGCAGLDLKMPENPFAEGETAQIPSKMIPVWTDTVLHTQGRRGVRGFGGRITFYREENGEPIRVEGSIVVYAWDDSDDPPGQQRQTLDSVPDRKYVFTAEQLHEHYSESKLGHSYSLWLPWEEVGGLHRRVTLISRFIGQTGGEITSQVARVVLPGPVLTPEELLAAREQTQAPRVELPAEPPIQSIAPAVPQMVLQAAYEAAPPQPIPATVTAARTTTIDVSPGFADRHFNHPTHVDVNHQGVSLGGATAEPQQAVNAQPHIGLHSASSHQWEELRSFPQARAADRHRQAAQPYRTGSSFRVPPTAPVAQAYSAETPAPTSDFAPNRLPARGALLARPAPASVRKAPLPARWPSALPAIPRTDLGSQYRRRFPDAAEVEQPATQRPLGH